CFAAGTPLLTPDGHKPIEQFAVGDLILSRNESDPTGPVTARRVLRVFVRHAEAMHVRVGGKDIVTTAEHPFYVGGRGWVVARLLKAGDVLHSHNDCRKMVTEVVTDRTWQTVYNLEVEDDHTYFVGEAEWGWSAWAHNQCDPAVEQAHE